MLCSAEQRHTAILRRPAMAGTRFRVLLVFIGTILSAAPLLWHAGRIPRAWLPTQAVLDLPLPPPLLTPTVSIRLWAPGMDDVALESALDDVHAQVQHSLGAGAVLRVEVLPADAIDIGEGSKQDVAATLRGDVAGRAAPEVRACTTQHASCDRYGDGPVLYVLCSERTRANAWASAGLPHVSWRSLAACASGAPSASLVARELVSLGPELALQASKVPRPSSDVAATATAGFDAPPTAVHIAVSIVNADPDDWYMVWDAAGDVTRRVLRPLVAVGRQVGMDVTYTTQKVMYADLAPRVKALQNGSHVLTRRALEGFTSCVGEWDNPGSPEVAEGAALLRLVLYVPAARHCPLFAQGRTPSGHASLSSAFVVRRWGAVVIVNPPACAVDPPPPMTAGPAPMGLHGTPDAEDALRRAASRLRALLGLPATLPTDRSGGAWAVVSALEVEALQAAWFRHHLAAARESLQATVSLAQRMSHMRVSPQLARQVSEALQVYERAVDPATPRLDAIRAAQMSRTRAQAAALDPDMVPQLYFPAEHLAAVYAPFLLPLALPLVLGTVTEMRGWLARRRAMAAQATGRES